MNRLRNAWKQYRYRFVPWLALNLKDRSVRSVTRKEAEVLLPDSSFQLSVTSFLAHLHQHHCKPKGQSTFEDCLQLMRDEFGFTVECASSILPGGGTGVKVTSGRVKPGDITSLYAGLMYEPYEPIFFQSINNPFIFRCADGVMIDGNNKGLSKSLFKSCNRRDSFWPIQACDESWLTGPPKCPLNVGQFVNNHTRKYPANVAYQEYSIPENLPITLRQYLPNIHYSSILQNEDRRLLRIVALIATREIQCGEELFSSYFTIVS